MKKKIHHLLMKYFFGRQRFQRFFEICVYFGYLGLNVGRGWNFDDSGELRCLENFIRKHQATFRENRPFIFWDVGANDGSYVSRIYEILQRLHIPFEIFAFEPASDNFALLSARTRTFTNTQCFKFGFGSVAETGTLFTGGGKDSTASIYADYTFPHGDINQQVIEFKTVDDALAQSKYAYIDYLKMDTEGSELEILAGAKQSLKEGKINAVQFEFGPANLASRSFFYDFHLILQPAFEIYRITQDGLWKIKLKPFENMPYLVANYLAVYAGAFHF